MANRAGRAASIFLIAGVTLGVGGCRGRGEAHVRAVPGGPPEHVANIDRLSALQRLTTGLRDPIRVELPAGTYTLAGVPFRTPTCSTCPNPAVVVHGTYGLRLSGHGIRLVGASAETVTLSTDAGCGILFEDCRDCSVENVTITGGKRDGDPNAADAAIACVRSSVRISRCILSDNLGKPSPRLPIDVGIGGVVVRDSSTVELDSCTLSRNSGDGVAVFSGSSASVRGSIVDGVDRGQGPDLPGGRGVGLAAYQDGRLVAEGTLVTRYLRGARLLGGGGLEARRCAFEEITGPGIEMNDLGSLMPVAIVEDSAIVVTGACGARLLRSAPAPLGGAPPGAFRRNAIVLTGQNPAMDSPDVFCRQVALDLASVPDGFVIEDNVYFANREDGGGPGREDSPPDVFRRAIAPLLEEMRKEPALAGSRFLRDFGK